MTIPNIIHQIAPHDKLRWHPLWYACYQSWKAHFCDAKFYLWNDQDDLENFISDCYPQFIETFKQFPYAVMKYNFARFALLHHFGGIYTDMDIFCYSDFYADIKDKETVLVENYLAETVNAEVPYEICLMASAQGNSYFMDCMETSVEHFHRLKHLFDKQSVDDQWLCMQITDSFVLIQARDIHNSKQIELLPYPIYNNRAASYDSSFKTKHMRSSSWNTKYKSDQYLIVGNLLFSVSAEDASVHALMKKAKDQNIDCAVINIKDFDFYTDYTHGSYFYGSAKDAQLKLRTKQLYERMIK